MTPEQKTGLLKYLDDFMDGGAGPRAAHEHAETLLLEIIGDADIIAKWAEAKDWWWYA